MIDNDELAKILHIDADGDTPYTSAKVSMLYRIEDGAAGLERRLDEICQEIDALGTAESSSSCCPTVTVTPNSARSRRCWRLQRHTTTTVRNKRRTKVSLLVESGDVREVHHVALLIGYGAAAVNPYLAMESVEDLVRHQLIEGVDSATAVRNLVKALGKGVLKVMSKMGISTVASYRGAQVFEAIGLSSELIDKYFTGTTSKLGGVGLDVLAEEVAARHRIAYPPNGIPPAHRSLVVGGEYQWRREGEPHLFNPETVFRLQHATRESGWTSSVSTPAALMTSRSN